MGISRKDMLMGLMHSAEQGKKLREGTDLATKKLNEAGQQRGPVMINPFGGNDPRPGWGSIYGQLANTTIVPTKETNPTLVSPPGKPEVPNPDARTGFGSDRQETMNLGKVSSSEASSVNQHGNVRKGMNQDIVSLPDQAEQRRRENSEAEMRRRSAPDAAINREPVMPSELRKESNVSNRGKLILETLNSILFQK